MKKIKFLLIMVLLTGCATKEDAIATPSIEPLKSPEIVQDTTEYEMIDLFPEPFLEEVNKKIELYNNRSEEDKYIGLKQIEPITKDSSFKLISVKDDTYPAEREYNIYLNDTYSLNVLLRIDELNYEYTMTGIVLNFYETDKGSYEEEREIIAELEVYLKNYADVLKGRVFDDVGNEVDENGEMYPRVYGVKNGVRTNTTEDVMNFYRQGIVGERVDEVIKMAYTKEGTDSYLIDRNGIPYKYICQCGGIYYAKLQPFLDEIIAVKDDKNDKKRIEVMAQKHYTEYERNYLNKGVEVIDLKKENGKWKIINADDQNKFDIDVASATVPIPYYVD